MGIVALVMGKLPSVTTDPKTPQFILTSITTGQRVVLPLAPLPSSHSGFGVAWETLGRGGRAGYLVPVDIQPKIWSASLTVAYPQDRLLSIDQVLRELEELRNTTDRVAISYGRPERGVWRFTDLSYDLVARQPGTNEATQASVTLTLQQAVDVPTVIGPKRAGAASTKANPPVPPKTPKTKTHTVRAGETLITISQSEYGDALQWRRIGDANGLAKASPLVVGKVLKLP